MVSLLRASLPALAFLLGSSASPAAAQTALAEAPSDPRPAALRAAAPAAPRAARALDFEVSGVVRGSDDNLTLPGVNVLVKGTATGVATGLDGAYALAAPTELDTLVFSYIGYETQEVPILGRSVIDVELRPEGFAGDEVVVIGYGSREVRDLTGSVGVVTSEEIAGKPLASFEDALAGQVAGVQVQQNSGDQIGNFSVDIRGVGSFSGSNRPLYVVDGVPLDIDDVAFLSSINPADIESISVLKDASSASIYGTRAADGVVIITTKTGAGQAPQIRFTSLTGVSQPFGNIEMLSSADLAAFIRDSRRNAQGNNPTYELPGPLQDPAFLAANDVDWQDELTRDNALQQSYNLNALGSAGPFQYSASGSYETDEGLLIGTDFSKASIRLNGVAELSRRATLDVRLNGSRQWGSVVGNDQTFGAAFRDGLYKYPWEQPYNPDGTFAEYDLDDPERGSIYSQAFGQNPVADILEQRLDRQYQQFIGNVAFTYDLPLNLRYRGSGSANLSRKRADDFVPAIDRIRYGSARETATARANDESGFNYFTDHTLTLDYERGSHDVEVLGGTSFQTKYREFLFVAAQGGINNEQRAISLQPEIVSASGAREQNQVLLSYFGRVEYDFADKYFVTGTLRRDGSSKFANTDNVWGLFPAVAVSWRASSEPFFRSLSAVDDLRFRASYGELGDNGIRDNATLNTLARGFVGFGDDPVVFYTPNNIATRDLRWETVRQLDVGMDLTMLRGRLALTADAYNRETVDILLPVGTPPAFPVGTIAANIGSVQNRGFELGLNTVPVRSGAFTWNLDATFGYNDNTVLSLGEDVLGESTSLPGRTLAEGPFGRFRGPVNRTEVGRSIGEFYVWEFVGICGTADYDEAANACGGITGLRPGDTLYRDLDGDGAITDADRSFQGSGLPKMFGGVTSSFQIGPVGLQTLFTYALGRKVLDTQRIFGLSGDSNINKRAEVLDRWTPDNQDTDIPRALQGPQGYLNVRPSTFFLSNADFLSLRSLTLSYAVPTRWLGAFGGKRAEIALVGNNLFTWTGYSGINPEVSSGQRTGSGNIDASSAPTSPGLDFTTYPLSRTISARVTLTL